VDQLGELFIDIYQRKTFFLLPRQTFVRARRSICLHETSLHESLLLVEKSAFKAQSLNLEITFLENSL